MNGKRITVTLSAVAAVVFAGVFVQSALRAEAADGAKPPAAAKPAPKQVLSRLERLPCFGCHNIEHYRKGRPKPAAPAADAAEGKQSEEFSHTLHQEQDVGHCHVCHAFEGHFKVTIRKETCAGCH